MCVPTSSRVSRSTDEQIGVETTQCLCQAVANLLQPAGQARIIEHEPGVIFNDSQALAGTVGRGVQNPADIHRSGRVEQVERGDFFERSGGADRADNCSQRWLRNPSSSSP